MLWHFLSNSVAPFLLATVYALPINHLAAPVTKVLFLLVVLASKHFYLLPNKPIAYRATPGRTFNSSCVRRTVRIVCMHHALLDPPDRLFRVFAIGSRTGVHVMHSFTNIVDGVDLPGCG